MKAILFASLVAIGLLAGMASAQETKINCVTPLPSPCTQIVCSNETHLPGLWEVSLYSGKKCGPVTLVGGTSAIIDIPSEGKVFLLLNKVKRMLQVESCP